VFFGITPEAQRLKSAVVISHPLELVLFVRRDDTLCAVSEGDHITSREARPAASHSQHSIERVGKEAGVV
jgi:hypothetical protein